MRAHYRAPITDTQGNLLPGTTVSIFDNGTTTLLGVPIYADGTTATLLPNPYITPDGNLSFYLDAPQRVDVEIAPPGQTAMIIPDLDVEISGVTTVQLTFPGTGTASTAVGNNSVASATDSAAFGDTASASGV